MSQDGTLPIPESIDGSTGSVRATLKLRNHGFEPARNRRRVRPEPSAETKERVEWLSWLSHSVGYDFDDDDYDPHDVAPEHRIEIWRAQRNARKAQDTLDT